MALFPEQPDALFARGEYRHGELLLGSTSNEFDYFSTWFPVPKTRLDYTLMTTALWSAKPFVLLDHYMPETDAEASSAWLRQQGDGMFRCPMRDLALAMAAHGDPVFQYSFDVMPGVHGLELDYVFGWPGGPNSQNYPDAPQPPIPSLVEAVQRYWAQFAATGNPNRPGLPEWPVHTVQNNLQLTLDRQVRQTTGLTAADCDVWKEYLQ